MLKMINVGLLKEHNRTELILVKTKYSKFTKINNNDLPILILK